MRLTDDDLFSQFVCFCAHRQPSLQIPRSAQPEAASFDSPFGVTDVSHHIPLVYSGLEFLRDRHAKTRVPRLVHTDCHVRTHYFCIHMVFRNMSAKLLRLHV
jgi:hypothetical protein